MDFRGKNIDLVGKMRLWFSISLVLMFVSLFSLAVFGLNLGIDFKGGGQFSYRIPAEKRPTGGAEVEMLNQVRGALEGKGVGKLQVVGGDTLQVSTDARDTAELRSQERAITATLSKQFATTGEYGPIGQQL
ncbi:MAG TPA: hypothetical protein VF719_02940, partial [Abditibacteriaceae bacterium]